MREKFFLTISILLLFSLHYFLEYIYILFFYIFFFSIIYCYIKDCISNIIYFISFFERKQNHRQGKEQQQRGEKKN